MASVQAYGLPKPWIKLLSIAVLLKLGSSTRNLTSDSQERYFGPLSSATEQCECFFWSADVTLNELVEAPGLEPGTLRLKVFCSSRLSYTSIFRVLPLGIEPRTRPYQGRMLPLAL